MDVSKLKKKYDELIPNYEKLALEITDKLTKRIFARNIKIHSLKYRIKDYDSFYKKIIIKHYEKPFSQCTDLLGCRIVCLFEGQIPLVMKIIEGQFEIIESFQKGKETVNQFAYSSYHILVKKKKLRKDEKPLVCEIQIRTILQEAWAEIEHHINYKNVGADKDLLRKINALAAMFEIADDQFHGIHEEYLKITQTPVLSGKNINGVLLYNFCKQTFPWAWKNAQHFKDLEDLNSYEKLSKRLIEKRIKTLKDLEDVYNNKKEELDKDEEFRVKEILNNPMQWTNLYNRVKSSEHFYSPIVIIGMIINSI